MNTNNQNLVKSRIEKIMRSQGLKRYTLAEKAGIANPTIQNWYTNRNYQPTLYSLSKVSEVLHISLSELFLEEDATMFPVNQEQKQLLELYQKLTPHNRNLLIDLAENLKKE